ncbi:hypothetical protein ASG89_15590 [Paenibacillus sp. Soil766]|uniref:hypothetical protein n=1 Tax=Paenibacillus sp. Soil766 TaxID=1736404 RepID=UPI00070A9BFB|nr:hypothetical protein [Paenibacillus sp. Soil766]KRF09639.1 hypothetical protein ASG89_15590 [Paenibacillus sp. Soil766]
MGNIINRIQDAVKHISMFYEQELYTIEIFNLLLQNVDEITLLLMSDDEVNSEEIIFLKDSIERNNDKDDIDGIEGKHIFRRKLVADYLLKLYLTEAGVTDQEGYIYCIIFLQNRITETTHNMYSYKERFYYKNILCSEKRDNFEGMTGLIRNELINFDVNLFYCEKILKFINDEFKVKGVFPTDLIFVKQFINNSYLVLILTSTKLFSTAKPEQSNNFGFDYLKHYNFLSCISDLRESVKEFNRGEVKDLIKRGKELVRDIIDLRHYYIAHYDIANLHLVKKIELDLQLFKDIYDVSVRIFELLSLHRFQRLNITYTNLIQLHGFKETVCQNKLLRGMQSNDIDRFFNALRKNFLLKEGIAEI